MILSPYPLKTSWVLYLTTPGSVSRKRYNVKGSRERYWKGWMLEPRHLQGKRRKRRGMITETRWSRVTDLNI